MKNYISPKGTKAFFNECVFRIVSSFNSTKYFYIPDSKPISLYFNQCDIKYADTVDYFIEGIILPQLVISDCNINIYKNLVYYRGGLINLNNNIINCSESINSFVNFSSLNINADTVCYFTNNKTDSDVCLCTLPIQGNNSSTIEVYDNNPQWTFGKTLRFTRYDKITSFNGGTGSLVTVKQLTNYDNDSVPDQGYWLIGQVVKKTTGISTTLGWICTSSGDFEDGTTPTFTAISI